MMHGNPFYCSTHAEKIEALEALVGETRDMQRLLDDISDGCGGCERLGCSNDEGGMDWISVLTDEGSRVHYAWIGTDQNGIIIRATYGSICMMGGQTQDSLSTYTEMLANFKEWTEEEE